MHLPITSLANETKRRVVALGSPRGTGRANPEAGLRGMSWGNCLYNSAAGLSSPARRFPVIAWTGRAVGQLAPRLSFAGVSLGWHSDG